MAITGVIYSNQKVSAQDHAALFQLLISDGIIYGCGCSSRLNNFTISSGAFIAAGRLTRIDGSQTIELDTNQSNVYARIKGVCDMTQRATAEEFHQFYFSTEYSASADGFPELVRQNINADGEKYEFTWAILTIGENGIITNIDVKFGQSHSGGTGGAITEAVFSSYGTANQDYIFASSGDDWEVAFLTSNAHFQLGRDLENVDVFLISAGDDGGTGSAYIDDYTNISYGGSGANGGDYISFIGTTIPFGEYNVHIGANGNDKITSFGSLFTSDSLESQHKEGGRRGYAYASQNSIGQYAAGSEPAGNGDNGVLAWGDSSTLIYSGRIYGSSSGGGGAYAQYTYNGTNNNATGARGSSGTNAGESKSGGSDSSASAGAPGTANTGSAGGAGGSYYSGGNKVVGIGGLGGSGIILIRNHKETPAA